MGPIVDGSEGGQHRDGSPGGLATRPWIAALWQRGLHLVRSWVRFWELVVRRFVEDQCIDNAASLTYTTLLSLVPLMTVTLAVLSVFPISERLVQDMEAFVFHNFVPTAGDALRGHLETFRHQATQVSGFGFLSLVVVALMQMASIDVAINRIWRVSRQRSTVSRLMEYWFMLTLVPLLIGISLGATSYLMPIFSQQHYDALLDYALRVAPIFASLVAFTFIYSVVPNRRVPFSHALAGGLLAAVMFESAKKGFALYLVWFPTYEMIYGALAMVPIFLIWLYLSWSIALLGAEVAYCLGVFRDASCLAVPGSRSEFMLALKVMETLWRAQQKGVSLKTKSISRALHHAPEEYLEALLADLHAARLVLLTDRHEWALARDLNGVTLLDLFRLRPFVLPDTSDPVPDPLAQALAPLFGGLQEELGRAMALPLGQVFAGIER